MKKTSYFNSHNIPLALSNLCNRIGGDCSITDITDAIEDATSAEELRDSLNALHLLERFSIDRVTTEYVRLISVDRFGNKHYLKAWF